MIDAQRPFHGVPLAVALLVTLIAVPSLVGPVGSARAEPTSEEVRSRLEDAQAQLDRIEERVSLAVEEYHRADEALEAARAEADAARAELGVLTARADAAHESVVDHVRRLHKLGPTMELSVILISSDATVAGRRSAALRRILDDQRAEAEELSALTTAQRAAEERLTAALAEAEHHATQVEQRRAEVQATLSDHEQRVGELQGELEDAVEREERRRAEQRRLEEERREAELARQQAAAAAASAGTDEAEPASSASAVRRSAQTAVDTALAQIGKPYRWGGNGPGAFDCSGLMRFAWRAAGVELPRSSRAQYGATTRIPRSELEPGDLVFYHSPISHVAMYIGGGKVVEAPYSGNSVRIRHDGLSRSGIVGYGRP